jgi:hypothetical protein
MLVYNSTNNEKKICLEKRSVYYLQSVLYLESQHVTFPLLGFEMRHTKKGMEIADRDDTVIRMKDGNGFHIDILQSETGQEQDTVGIRMNVDDFDEAYKMLRDRGFKNLYGDETVNTASSKAAMMVSPSGFVICIIRHIK